jgi:hypothetical protein
MGKYILIFIMGSQPPAQLGAYESLELCQAAIRSVLTSQLAPGSENNPKVKEAIDLSIRLQREYFCMKAGN